MVRILTIGLSFYWFFFWLMNALDKVLNRQDLGILRWNGRERSGQFAGYLEKMNLSVDLYVPLMIFAFVVELAVALAFLRVLVVLIKRRHIVRFMPQECLKLPIFLSIMVFTGFSVFDVVAGDRAELLEHGTYMCLVGVTWIIASFESVLDVVPQRDYAGTERRSETMTDRRGDVD